MPSDVAFTYFPVAPRSFDLSSIIDCLFCLSKSLALSTKLMSSTSAFLVTLKFIALILTSCDRKYHNHRYYCRYTRFFVWFFHDFILLTSYIWLLFIGCIANNICFCYYIRLSFYIFFVYKYLIIIRKESYLHITIFI